MIDFNEWLFNIFLLMDSINPSSTWWSRLSNLMLTEFPDLTEIGLDLKSMGTTENWTQLFIFEDDK